jgi:hypothetical protein
MEGIMVRIRTENLPKDSTISEAEMRGIIGGSFVEKASYADINALGFDTSNMEGVKLWSGRSGRARVWSLKDGIRIEFKSS